MRSLTDDFRGAVAAAFASRTYGLPRLLLDAHLDHLPPVVARYVRASGAVGRPQPRNLRVVMSAEMVRSPGAPPMAAKAVQYTFFDRPERIFLMKARMRGLPVLALHILRGSSATFQVRAAGLVDVTDLSGPRLAAAESVTFLQEMCVYAPGSLTDPRLVWGVADEHSAEVTFTNGPHRVTATLEFDAGEQPTGLWSDDRSDASTGEFVQCRWRTPLTNHSEWDGIRIPSAGSAVYERPEGPFEYGRFQVTWLGRDLTAAV